MYLYCISNRSARLSTKVVKVVHPFDGCPLGHHHLLSTNVASVAIERKHLEDENEELSHGDHQCCIVGLLILGFSQSMEIFCLPFCHHSATAHHI